MPDRRHAAVVATLAAALTVAGCAGVPDHSGVHEGALAPAAAAEQPLDIRLLVRAATPGASPTDIVRGFLTASASYDSDHAIARTYLTDEGARTWVATDPVVVYDDSATAPVGTPRSTGGRSIVPIRAPELARIDADGAYTVSAPTARLAENLRLVRERGEWRIANPPRGVILTPLDLARSLQQLHIYYLARGLDVVVPDNVYLATTSTGRSTALIRALLRGPTGWLAPAVRTAIPGGTVLIGTAPVDGHGVVTVDLSRQVLEATATQRAQLSAQIVWTLRQLSDVTRVRILVEGTPLDVPGAPPVQSRDGWPGYDPDALPAGTTAYYRTGGRLVTVNGAAVPGPLGLPGSGVRHVALSPGSDLVGGLRRADGRTVVYAGSLTQGPEPVVDAAANFTPPSWDVADEMWTVQRGPVPRVFVYQPGLPVTEVPAPALAGRDIRRLRVSRDGTRVAAVFGSGTGGAVFVGRVRTTAGGLRLDGFRLLTPELVDVVDVAWADASTVMVLGRDRSGRRQPWLVDVDGSDTAAVSTTGLASYDAITAAPDQPPLVASAGQVYVARRGLWSSVGRGSEPAYRG